jgi:hypothetical protein
LKKNFKELFGTSSCGASFSIFYCNISNLSK